MHRLLTLGSAALVMAGCSGDGGPDAVAADAGLDHAVEAEAPQLPCAVAGVLQGVCQQCHSSPPINGAPFPLVTWADTHALYFDVPIWQLMQKAVASGSMPLPPVTISAEQKDTLLDWLDKGAMPDPAAESCKP